MYLNETKMAKLAIDKSLLKEYKADGLERVVYMNNGNEFQIQLFNPETRIIGAEVSINGELLPGIIIIKPGERVWLERYTDKAVKLKFSTYEVEDTVEVKNAIANNGEVKVKFYHEQQRSYNSIWDNNITLVNKNSFSNDDLKVYTTCDNKLYNNTYTTSTSLQNSVNSTKLDNLKTLFQNRVNCGYIPRGKSAENYATATTCLNSTDFTDTKYTASNNTNSIETGRINEGSYSSQTFTNAYNNFEYSPFAIETIKILPVSRKPFNKKDLQKVYCSQCGRKLNPKYKFCPYCGAKCI